MKNVSGTTCVSMDIATELLKAENVGKKQFEKFIAERVESNNVSFYAPNQKKKRNHSQNFEFRKK